MGDLSKDLNSKFANNRLKAMINIMYTANWLRNHQNTFFKPYKISPQQFNILRILKGADSPIKVQVVKDRMIERAPNLTRLTDKLLDKGLIIRLPCPDDRRVVYLEITKQGMLLLDDISKTLKDDWLDNLTEAEALQLTNLLDKIR
ncbi:MarR family transcriptional regulator [uncultured Algibacter sp.]|uniref:MarR family winged helix-turn-helix transcriptional regulator n=1 Tax=uncultured Algibacter sp. TaxID=298659 RepID=UPI003217431F